MILYFRVPNGLLQVKCLTSLALNDTNIVELPPAIGNLNKLVSLDLRENMLETIPQYVVCFLYFTVKRAPNCVNYRSHCLLSLFAKMLKNAESTNT